MSKRNSILIILAIVLLIIGGLVFFYFSNNAPKNIETIPITTTSPFGNTSGNKTSATGTQTTENTQTTTTKNLAKLIQLYKNPTSGTVFFLNNNNQNVLRFVDRAVGNIYEYIPENQTGEAQRITNTTIPKIQETAWSNTGNNLVFRYLNDDTDNIDSFSATIKANSNSSDAPGEITGSFLSSNIKQLVINPKGDKIFGIVDKSDKSGTIGFTANLDGGNKKIIFDSPISYWNVSWPKENTILLTTKPNFRDFGLSYFFNPQTYSMDRMLGGVVGMSTIANKDTSFIAYSYSENSLFYLDVYDVINKISKGFKIATLSDKCVWGNNNTKILYCAIPNFITPDNYPDVWYQGLQSFNDNLWEIDIESGTMTEIYQIGLNENVDIDVSDLKISLDDQYLSFSNKNDLSLWLLQIKEQ